MNYDDWKTTDTLDEAQRADGRRDDQEVLADMQERSRAVTLFGSLHHRRKTAQLHWSTSDDPDATGKDFFADLIDEALGEMRTASPVADLLGDVHEIVGWLDWRFRCMPEADWWDAQWWKLVRHIAMGEFTEAQSMVALDFHDEMDRDKREERYQA